MVAKAVEEDEISQSTKEIEPPAMKGKRSPEYSSKHIKYVPPSDFRKRGSKIGNSSFKKTPKKKEKSYLNKSKSKASRSQIRGSPAPSQNDNPDTSSQAQNDDSIPAFNPMTMRPQVKAKTSVLGGFRRQLMKQPPPIEQLQEWLYAQAADQLSKSKKNDEKVRWMKFA